MTSNRTLPTTGPYITIPRSTLYDLQEEKHRGDRLHVALCQALGLLNVSPEVARCADARRAHDILRQALIDYADAVQAKEAGR